MSARARRAKIDVRVVIASVCGCLLGLSQDVAAAPRPWGIAIDARGKACSAYWGGDEFVSYDLAPGWTDYYPAGVKRAPEDVQRIVTPHGTCVFTHGKERACCAELGLTYRGMRWPMHEHRSPSGACGVAR